MARSSDQNETFHSTKRRRRVFDDEEIYSSEDLTRFERMRILVDEQPVDDGPPTGERWSIWDQSEPLQRGPQPWPDWVITDLGAVDHELGVLKTGKEADVFLIEREVPGTSRSVILASKRYRSAEHTQFNRAGDYMAGRGTRRSRDARAMARRTTFGLQQAAARWAAAEFEALSRLHTAGVPVPYPVQVLDTEVVMEFIGDGRTAAPRLSECRPDARGLHLLWDQAREAVLVMAELGFAHGDLSPYNTVVQDGRLVVLDLPQIVDVYANPLGMDFLARDVENLGGWFVTRGVDRVEVDELQAELSSLVLGSRRVSGTGPCC